MILLPLFKIQAVTLKAVDIGQGKLLRYPKIKHRDGHCVNFKTIPIYAFSVEAVIVVISHDNNMF